MKFTSMLFAFTMFAGLSIGPANADVLTTNLVTIADGRVQSSGVLGQELFTSAEDIQTSRSGASNISDGLYEFDLSSLPDDAVLMNAEILFRTAAIISNTNSTAPVEFYGFTGNGSLELADEGASATLAALMDFTTAVGNDENVSASFSNLAILESVLADANSNDFFTLRSETVNFVTFRVDSLESLDPNSVAATLRLTYETASVPEPSALALLGLAGVRFIARRRR